jgi:uncharacterized repeat protein (TIGR01451 family)
MLDLSTDSSVFALRLDAARQKAEALIRTALETQTDAVSQIFGASEALDRLVEDWVRLGPDLTRVRVLSAADMMGAQAAYLADRDLVLVSDALFAPDMPDARLVDVLIEEIGHRIDARVNHIDTPGDEGRAFAAVVRGEPVPVSFPAESFGLIALDGEILEVETAVSVSDSGGYEGSFKTITLESTGGGTITYSYEMYGIPDRLVIRYEGRNLLDTGFVSYSRTGTLELPAGTSDSLEVLIITDNQGTAWYYTVSVAGCADVRPWQITSLGTAFANNAATGKCETSATITVGRTDGVGSMIRAIQATAAYDRNGLKVEAATIQAQIGGDSRSLFFGDFDINFATGRGAVNQVQPGTFKMGSRDVEFKSIAMLSSKVVFGVSLTLPEEATGRFIDTESFGVQGLVFDGSGASMRPSMKFSIPNLSTSGTFKLAGFVDASASDLSLEYRGAEDALRVQGKVSFEISAKPPALGVDPDLTVEADFAGNNYIQVNSDGDVEVVGSLKVKKEFKIGGFTLSEISLSLDSTAKLIRGTATIGTPFGVKFGDEGISAKPTIGFTYSPISFDTVGLTIDNINKPIPAYPLFFFQSIGGMLENLSANNPKAAEISATVGATLGPQIKGTSLLRGDLTAKISKEAFTLSGELKALTVQLTMKFGSWEKYIGEFTLATFTGQHELNWKEGHYAFTGTGNFIDGFVTTSTSFKADTGFNFAMSGASNVGIPGFIPMFGGYQIVGGRNAMKFSNDGDFSNDFIAGWGTININKFGVDYSGTFGVRFGFDGSVTRIGANNIPTTSSWFIEPGRDFVLLTAIWENDAPGMTVRVILPDGTVVEEADFAAHQIAVVEEFSDATTRTVLIANPASGTWDLEVSDPSALGNIHYEASGLFDETEMTFTAPPVILADGSARFAYAMDSAAPVVTVSFYYDDDLDELDGVFAGSVSVAGTGNGLFDWAAQNVAPGDYYLYALVEDGSGVVTVAQTATTLRVGSQADLGIEIKTEGAPDSGIGGVPVRYVVTVTNHSPGMARGAKVLFNAPDDMTLGDVSLPTEANDFADFAVVLGDIAGGATRVFTVDATLAGSAADPFAQVVDVHVLSDSYDPLAENDTATTQTIVRPVDASAVSLMVEARDLPTGAVTLGQTFSYTVRVSNEGSQTATGVILFQTLSGVTDIGFGGLSSTPRAGGFDIALPDIAAGSFVDVSVTGRPNVTGTIRGRSEVRSDQALSNLLDGELMTAIPVQGTLPDQADLSVTLSDGQPNAFDGLTRLTVSVRNDGPGIATNVSVHVDLPPGASVANWSAVQGSFDAATGLWTLGNMRDNLTRSITLVVVGGINGPATAQVWTVDQTDPDSSPANGIAGEDDQASLALRFLSQVGSPGDDRIDGTTGADTIDGAAGNDTIRGEEGNDILTGGAGRDEIRGGAGNDLIRGGTGADLVYGGSGADTIYGDEMADTLYGESGNDLVFGGSGNDSLNGGTGNDRLRGDIGNDTIYGGDGNDRLFGASGNDVINGGAGNDYIAAGAGFDTVYGVSGDNIIFGGGRMDMLYGGVGNDTINGDSGRDLLDGGDGNDVLHGGRNADTIIGGLGSDTMTGGQGYDVFVFRSAAESPNTLARDLITDFRSQFDKIDLSALHGDLRLVSSFGGRGGDVVFDLATTRLLVDLDGNRSADFSVQLQAGAVIELSDLIF